MTGESRRASVRGGFRLNLHAHAMVYRAMWKCNQCEYHNEDWDEACAKCGASHEQPESMPAQPSSPVIDNTLRASNPAPVAQPAVPPELVSKEQRRRDPVTLLVVLLVIFMVATLGLLGYIAWQRGMISMPGSPSLDSVNANDGTAAAIGGSDLAPIALNPLQELASSKERAAKPYRAVAKDLLEIHTELKGRAAPPPDPAGELTAEQQDLLDRLNTTGLALIELYKQFDTTATGDDNPDAAGYQETIAAEFTSLSEKVTQLAGHVYGSTTAATHDAFLLPDLFKSYYAPGRRVGLKGIDESWAQAKEARVQLKLDAQYPEEIRQLTARLEALKDVHRGFKEQLDSIPPYEVRAGNLNKAAEDALAVLDRLMDAVEGMVREHAVYVATLQDIEPSETMQRLEDEFVQLAQDDHYFCFSEICRISVDDQNPQQPAYDALPAHYEFVGEYWPSLSIEYLNVFEESERDWRMKWQGG